MTIPQRVRHLCRLAVLLAGLPLARVTAQEAAYTHADTLRGSITPERAWWDVAFYDLHVAVDPADSSIAGCERHHLPRARARARDADRPPGAARRRQHGAGRQRAGLPPRRQCVLRRRSRRPQRVGDAQDHHGLLPRQAARRASTPPWDGGFIWARDSLGNRGSPPPIRGSAPASGGRTRTRRPTSRTASAWRSRFPIR